MITQLQRQCSLVPYAGTNSGPVAFHARNDLNWVFAA
jgi:hypothetical protein